MSPDLDAFSKRMAEEITRGYESDIMRMLMSPAPPMAFKFIEPKFEFEPIYEPERDGSAFSKIDWCSRMIVHQPSALLMVTACDSDGVLFTARESRAIANWNRAKARKDRRRTRYWAGVCWRLQRNGH